MHRVILGIVLCIAAPAQTPRIQAVVSAANWQSGAFAPGSLISIFGANLAQTAAAASAPLPVSLGGVAVQIGGAQARLLYVSPQQINAQIPSTVTGSTATVSVSVTGGTAATQDIAIAPAAPGIFLAVDAATHIRGPVKRGQMLTIFATGLGAVANPPAEGANASGPPFSTVRGITTVSIGGSAVTPLYAGLAPTEPLGIDSVGLYEVEVQIPLTAALGDSVPIVVAVDGASSQPLNIAIQQEDPEHPLASWVQFGPKGAIVRVVANAASCPSATIDGQSQPMAIRAKASPPLWPVMSCELDLPSGAKSLAVGGAALPLPKVDVKRITVVGDTGCRMDATRIQSCYDPVQWPVATVARAAAASSPDILIHMGDYHYREVPCPAGNAGCAGSPWGYNWAAWNADLIQPMSPLFKAAPLTWIRGNHEQCSRAGEGWFRLLDPHPYTGSCLLYTDPYTVAAGPTQFFVIDSAEATDTTADPQLVAQFAPYFTQLRAAATMPTWLMMHHPMWGFDSTGTRNLSLQVASNNTLPDKVTLVLGGHIHTFQSLNFTPARVPQLIAGNSGDVLQAYAASTTNFNGMSVGNATVSDSALYKDFGFTTWTWDGTTWSAIARNTAGDPVFNCQLAPNTLSCKPAQ